SRFLRAAAAPIQRGSRAQEDVADGCRAQPVPVRDGAEMLLVEGRVVGLIKLPVPATGKREAGLRDPVRLPVLRSRHDLDAVAGLLVRAEEANRRPPEARLLRLGVEPRRDEEE